MFSRGIPSDRHARRELSLFVVGLGHPNKDKSNRQFEVAMCTPGEPVELRREPRNPVDPQAVAVFSARGTQLGYLPADRAAWIGGRLAQGADIRAVFQEPGDLRAVIRVNLSGEEPTLPASRAVQPSSCPPKSDSWTEGDWYPDAEPLDDFEEG